MNVLQDASAKRAIAEPPAKRLSASQEDWTQRALQSAKRMSVDEAYRLEIARRLS